MGIRRVLIAMVVAALGSAGIMISAAGPAVAGCDVNENQSAAPGVDCTFDVPSRNVGVVVPPLPPVPPPIPTLPPNPAAGCSVWVITPGAQNVSVGTSGVSIGNLYQGGAGASC